MAGTRWQPPGPWHDQKVRTVRVRAELCNPLQKALAAGEELPMLLNPSSSQGELGEAWLRQV